MSGACLQVCCWLVLAIAMPLVAEASDLDFQVMGCHVAGFDGDSLRVGFSMAAYVAASDSFEVDFPVRILFNGLPWADEHVVRFLIGGTVPCLLDPCRDDPDFGWCRRKTWRYKGSDITDETHCIPIGGDCYCPPLGDPVPQEKKGPPPNVPGQFQIFIDPDNIIPELDESNNFCSVNWNPTSVPEPPPGALESWGKVKTLYR